MTSAPDSPSVPVRVGFIGFGEVATVFSGALFASGADVLAYDVLVEEPGGMTRLVQRASGQRVRFVTLPELVNGSDWILSTVTSGVAESVARSVAPYLAAGRRYVDLNATAPAIKQSIAGSVRPIHERGLERGAWVSAG